MRGPKNSTTTFALQSSERRTGRPDPSEPLKRSGRRNSAADGIIEQIVRQPDAIALISQDRRYTYGDLGIAADSIASWLRRHGFLPGDVIAVHSGRTPNLIPALLGVWKAGLAFLVVNSSYPQASILERLRRAEAKAWIDVTFLEPGQVSEFLQQAQIPRCSPADGEVSGGSLSFQGNSEQLAYLAFTSGSTGNPRGVLGTHSPLVHFVDWQIAEFKLHPQDRFAMLSGIGHDPLLRDFLTPLSLGATLYVPDDAVLGDPREFAAWVNENQISVAHLTPARAQMLALGADLLNESLASLRYLFFGGETLSSKLAEVCQAAAANAGLVNFYGATETPQAIGYHRYDPTNPYEGRAIPLGRGIDSVQLLVTKKGGALCEIGEEGEIWIRTPHLSQGYLDDDASTCERFIVNPFTGDPEDRIFKTGDIGVFLLDGSVEFRRRNDRQLKVRGYRVEPLEIEAAMESHPAILRAFVIPISSPTGTELAGCFTSGAAHPITAAELKRHLAQQLPPALVPSRMVKLDLIPTTSNGKVDVAALELLARGPGATIDENASVLESWLIQCWAQMLGLTGISLDNNFFDLGGTSVTAARIVAAVEKKLLLRVPLVLLIEHPTVRSLAARLESGGLESSWNPLVLLSKGAASQTPLFLVHAIRGNVVGYRDLARQLGDRPVYALQSPALRGYETGDNSIEQMASRYLHEVRAVRPHGPYHLGGFSAGGLVAFEMAQQLQASGEEIGSVCLLDTESPLKTPLRVVVTAKLRKNVRTLMNLSRSEWGKFAATKRENLIMNWRMLMNSLPKTGQAEDSGYQAEVQFRAAREKYCPKQYDSRVILFVCSEGDLGVRDATTQQWRTLASGNLEVRQVPGHHDAMLSPPHVEDLAKALRDTLNTVYHPGASTHLRGEPGR